ncbi:MAG: 4-hydroxy-3-methylbut-2-enyl diphosphate reductase [Clostridia bacterium]|nr:4-hydroxy-3-methylbut-2-enyl diphosphate reductase [Clostridia bacterium]
MNVTVAKTAGFCFGVDNAVKSAFALAESPECAGRRIFTFGPLIHNDALVKKLEEMNIRVIESPDEAEPGDVVIIRAHGVPEGVIDALEQKGVTVKDATCPFVKKIHELVKREHEAGRRIIIIGDGQHPEVIGIKSRGGEDTVVISDVPESISEIICDNFHENIFSCVVQTTFNRKKYEKIRNFLKETLDEILFYDTICNATSKRQEEAEFLAKKSDFMVVVGSRKSSNTIKLFEICRDNCPNAVLIESVAELGEVDSKFLEIGVTAGASTPDWLIEEVLLVMDEVKSIENEVMTDEAVENAETVAETASENFDEMLKDSLVTVRSGEVVEKPIIKVDATRVYLDLGFKYEGYIDINEFDGTPEVGTMVKAFVVHVSDRDCEVKLSKSKVDKNVDLNTLEEAYQNKTPVTVKVVKATERGVIAAYGTAQLYISASKLDLRFVKKTEEKVGNELEVLITRFGPDERGRLRIGGDARVILEAKKKEQDDAFWNSLEVGKEYTGKVKGITKTGSAAFVELEPGYEGHLSFREASWRRITDVNEVLRKGDMVTVKVLSFDREKNHISLSAKKPEDDPWFDAENKFQVGDILDVTVRRFAKSKEQKEYGVFVDVEPGVTGLVHISHISNKRINSAADVLEIGQVVKAQVLAVDVENKKLSLGIKEVMAYDPPEKPEELDENGNPIVKEKKDRPRKERAARNSGEGADGEKFERKPRAPRKPKEEEFHDDITPSATSIADLIGDLDFGEETQDE